MQIAQEEMEQLLEQPAQQIEVTELQEESEVRAGSSEDTLATPSDFPAAYNYGSGIQSEWGYNGLYRKLPEPEDNQTVFNTAPDPSKIQVLYLWEEGNVPAQTEFTENMTGYYDSYDFRPYVTAIPVREGTPVKGAVVLLAGGAFQVRGNYTDTLPTAAHLRELGFQTFIVDYRPAALYPAGGSPGCSPRGALYPKECGCLRHRPGRHRGDGLLRRRHPGRRVFPQL